MIRMRMMLATMLTVALVASCDRADDSLRQRVETRLRAENVREPVDVFARRGVVTLRGTVNSGSERQHVEDVVKGVEGVVSVDDRLLVAQPPALTAATPDAEEAAAITSALAAAGFHGLRVDVHGEDVRIEGNAPAGSHDAIDRTVKATAPRARVTDATTSP